MMQNKLEANDKWDQLIIEVSNNVTKNKNFFKQSTTKRKGKKVQDEKDACG